MSKSVGWYCLHLPRISGWISSVWWRLRGCEWFWTKQVLSVSFSRDLIHKIVAKCSPWPSKSPASSSREARSCPKISGFAANCFKNFAFIEIAASTSWSFSLYPKPSSNCQLASGSECKSFLQWLFAESFRSGKAVQIQWDSETRSNTVCTKYCEMLWQRSKSEVSLGVHHLQLPCQLRVQMAARMAAWHSCPTWEV